MATREEMIEYRVSTKGETPDVAATKVDNHLRATGREKEIAGAVAKPAAKAPETPKPSPAVAAQVPRVYSASAPPDKTREYSDVAPPMTRSRAAEVMPKPETDLVGIKQGGEGVYAPRASAAPTGATRYAYVPSDARSPADQSMANMRDTLRKLKPALASHVDNMDDSEVREVYGKTMGI